MISSRLDAQIDIQFVKEMSESAAATAQGHRRRNPVAAKPEDGGYAPSRNVYKSELGGMQELQCCICSTALSDLISIAAAPASSAALSSS
jgi:hypothetical protein